MSVVAFRKPSEDSETSTALVPAATLAPATVEPPEDFDSGMRRPMIVGSLIVGVFVIGLGVWAALAPLGGAVLAPGVVKVEDHRKVVKQRDGGIISQILVRNGQVVSEGDVLVRMDDIQARSAFEVYDNQYMNLIARRARFMAEGSGAEEVSFPPILIDRKGEAAIAGLMSDQTELFEKRRQAIQNQADILTQRLAQLETRISGYQAQIDAISQQNALIDQELVGTRSLAERGFGTMTKVLELERIAAGLSGQVGSLKAQIAEAEQSKGETQMQINRLFEDRLTEGSQGLSDIQGDLANILPRLQSAKATLDLMDVRAPVTGTVFGLTQFTEGGVVAPGESLLEIVPSDGPMVIEANIPTTDITQVKVGMQAKVKLTAYHQSVTPSVDAEITKISADRVTLENGASFYTAEVRVDPQSMARAAEDLRLSPGMPAEVVIPTTERTALDYLIEPVLHSMDRAFRER